MPHIIAFESLRNSLNIGASQVAAICNLDPWMSDWELWKIKSGRMPKPPRTPAMEFGIAMEDKAIDAYYRDLGIKPDHEFQAGWREQVCAIHPTIPYLVAVADGWNGSMGVNVKVPSSQKVIAMAAQDEFESEWDDDADLDFARVRRIPRHYMIQCAAEMAVFGAYRWDYAVYDAERDLIYMCPVTWSDVWEIQRYEDGSPVESKTTGIFHVTLKEFWECTAIPLLERFMAHLESGQPWENRPETPMPDANEWQETAVAYKTLTKTINELEEEKRFARAKLKTMMGSRTFLSMAGYKATDKPVPASWGIKISVDSEASAVKVKEALAPLANAEGVKEIKDVNRAESRRFEVRPLNAKEVMAAK